MNLKLNIIQIKNLSEPKISLPLINKNVFTYTLKMFLIIFLLIQHFQTRKIIQSNKYNNNKIKSYIRT